MGEKKSRGIMMGGTKKGGEIGEIG